VLDSPLLTGVWFILMNEIFIFIHRLFINIGSVVCDAEFRFSGVTFAPSRVSETICKVAFTRRRVG